MVRSTIIIADCSQVTKKAITTGLLGSWKNPDQYKVESAA